MRRARHRPQYRRRGCIIPNQPHGIRRPTQADQAIFYSMICRYDIVRRLVLVEVGSAFKTLIMPLRRLTSTPL